LSPNPLEMKLFHIRLKAGPFCDAQCVENVSDNFDRSHLLQPRSKHQNLNITSPANAARSEARAESGMGFLAHFDLSHSNPSGMRQRAV